MGHRRVMLGPGTMPTADPPPTRRGLGLSHTLDPCETSSCIVPRSCYHAVKGKRTGCAFSGRGRELATPNEWWLIEGWCPHCGPPATHQRVPCSAGLKRARLVEVCRMWTVYWLKRGPAMATMPPREARCVFYPDNASGLGFREGVERHFASLRHQKGTRLRRANHRV